jgi:hypothetical protein
LAAERLENQRAWQSLPVAEQIRIYEASPTPKSA